MVLSGPCFPFVDTTKSVRRFPHSPRRTFFHVWVTLKNTCSAPSDVFHGLADPCTAFSGYIDVDINHDIRAGGAGA